MKQFEYDIELLPAYLNGLVSSNTNLVQIGHNVVAAKKALSSKKVKLVSGGGSGHEPTHAGFIGEGMLDAVAVGHVFASPNTSQIERAINAVDSGHGTILIVKNYTGDVLHFGLAAEKSQAAGKNVHTLVVGDDVSVGRSQGAIVGRRGLAGVAIVHKIVGAAAHAGLDIDSVLEIGQSVASNLATIAVSLDHCVVPGKKFSTELSDNQYEIGLGIHNEPGLFKKQFPANVSKIVEELLPYLLDKNDKDRAFVNFSEGDDVALLVNNLGGLSNFEIGVITDIVLSKIDRPIRVINGTFTTAFNGPGFSITLLNLSTSHKSVLQYLDAPTSAPGWAVAPYNDTDVQIPNLDEVHESISTGVKLGDHIIKGLRNGLENVIKAEPQITKYDTIAGDGDCGDTLKAGATGILKALDNKKLNTEDAVAFFVGVADIVDVEMGGTSGGLYSIYLTAFARHLRAENPPAVDLKSAAVAAKGALDVLFKYTKARIGDRTMIDALEPYIENLHKGLPAATEAAEKGVEETKHLKAKAGRAAYVGDLGEPIPDPGAYGLAELFKGFSSN